MQTNKAGDRYVVVLNSGGLVTSIVATLKEAEATIRADETNGAMVGGRREDLGNCFRLNKAEFSVSFPHEHGC